MKITRTIISLAILSIAFSSYAEEALPITLKLKFDKNFSSEALIIKKDGKYFMEKEQAQQLLEHINATKEFGEKIVDISQIGQMEVNEEDLSAVISLNPKYMPKQDFKTIGVNYNLTPTVEESKFATYTINFDDTTSTLSAKIEPTITLSDGSTFKASILETNKKDRFSGIESFLYTKKLEDKARVKLGKIVGQSNEEVYSYFGFQIRSNREEQANYIPYATTTINGRSETVGIADLYINGALTQSKEVRPGDFAFSGIYNPATANGQATVVIRNDLGQLQTVSAPLMSTPMNLPRGEVDYSLDTGLIGSTPRDLQDIFASGRVSYGLRDNITLFGSARTNADYNAFSIGSTIGTDYGTFRGSITDASKGGSIQKFGYFYRQKDITFKAEHTNIKNFDTLRETENKNQKVSTLSLGYKLPSGNLLSATYAKINNDRVSTVGTSFTAFDNVRFNVSLNHQSHRGYGIYISLDKSSHGKNVRKQYDSNSNIYSTTLNSSQSQNNSFDWNAESRVNTSTLDHKILGEVQYNNEAFKAKASANTDGAFNLNVSGSIIEHKNTLLLSKPIADSFVVMQGVPDVEVYSYNGEKGKTNSNGFLAFPTGSLSDQTVFVRPETGPAEVNIDKVKYDFNILPNSKKTIDIEHTRY